MMEPQEEIQLLAILVTQQVREQQLFQADGIELTMWVVI
jgi:hypothetical protein